jgi:hypothetical protein
VSFGEFVFSMAIKEIEGFNLCDIRKKLLRKSKEAHCLVTIVDFIFSVCIIDLMDELNGIFSSKLGNKAYDRSMLLGILLYCFHRHKYNLSDIAHECKVNNVLRIFTCNEAPFTINFKKIFRK